MIMIMIMIINLFCQKVSTINFTWDLIKKIMAESDEPKYWLLVTQKFTNIS